MSDSDAEEELRPAGNQGSASPALEPAAEEQKPSDDQNSTEAEKEKPAEEQRPSEEQESVEAAVEKPAEELKPAEEQAAAAGSKSEGSPKTCKMWCMFGLQSWKTKCGLSECSSCLRCKGPSGKASRDSDEPKQAEEQSSAVEQEVSSQSDDNHTLNMEESPKPADSFQETQPLDEQAKPEAAEEEEPKAAQVTDPTENAEEDMESALAPPQESPRPAGSVDEPQLLGEQAEPEAAEEEPKAADVSKHTEKDEEDTENPPPWLAALGR